MKKLWLLSLLILSSCNNEDEGSETNDCNYVPETGETTNIAAYSATLNGTLSKSPESCETINNTEQGFVYANTIQPTVADYKVNVNGTSLTANIENLNPESTYYARTFYTNADGDFYGNEVEFTTTEEPIAIGDFIAGGIVFYIDPNDPSHGLVCADEDLDQGWWGCYGTYISGASATAVGTGQANTTAIVNSCDDDYFAAKACDNLVYNGYDDWFLPSKDELLLMYINLHRHRVGNFDTTTPQPYGYKGLYWSSSDGETDGNAAWHVNFTDGSSYTYDLGIKNNALLIRPVRAF